MNLPLSMSLTSQFDSGQMRDCRFKITKSKNTSRDIHARPQRRRRRFFVQTSSALWDVFSPSGRIRKVSYSQPQSSYACANVIHLLLVDHMSERIPCNIPRQLQIFSPEGHPHLQYDKTVVSIGLVEFGDKVYCTSALCPKYQQLI